MGGCKRVAANSADATRAMVPAPSGIYATGASAGIVAAPNAVPPAMAHRASRLAGEESPAKGSITRQTVPRTRTQGGRKKTRYIQLSNTNANKTMPHRLAALPLE